MGFAGWVGGVSTSIRVEGRKIQLSSRQRGVRFPQSARSENPATRRESLMGKTIKLIQANLQYAKAASYTISGTGARNNRARPNKRLGQYFW
ncbi:hypothetical protein JTB14_001999 [Gonioctena quinquepunctata]|nr:hypothetical protein JTB14_001999 [Gonioctena quinquepunctata]